MSAHRRSARAWARALAITTAVAVPLALVPNAPRAHAQPGAAPTTGTAPAPAPSPTPAPQNPALSHEPGPNGPGLGPQRPVTRAVPPPVQLTPKEMDELKAVEGDYNNFIQAATDHDKRLRQIAKGEFDSRTGDLEKRYAERIAKTESNRSKYHTETIALLEKFLKDHPAHETFTPDAMFRLADLYLDAADEDVEQRLAAQEAAGSAANNPDAAAIVADYSKSIALWQNILTQFPSYRQTPSTLYLLGYFTKALDDRKSLEVFLALACANHYKWNDPPPPVPTRQEAIKRVETKQLRDIYADCTPYPNSDTELVRHAWVRGIADYHFTVAGELDEAIASYLKVANGGDESKLFSEALYKLAWSYYKRDILLESIKRFDQSIKLYDSLIAQGGQPALELRDESIQYISVAFTDPWEGETDTDPVKAFDRAKNFYKGRESEPHVRDVWVAMGHAFADLQAWDQAVDSYKIAIGPPWELDPHNPVVHQEIVNAFEAKGDKYAADQAAAELATKYAPGTAWYAANEKDREAMEAQHRIAERALYAAARNTHSAATNARKDYEAASKKDPAAKQDYLALYAKAVDLYRQFITTYQDSDYIYEFTFLEGEALFYSERYPEAIAQYKWVRDHRELGTAYYIDAAKSILASYEAEKDKEIADGRLAPLKVPSVAELQAIPQPWQQQQIPQVYVELQNEYDNYQNIVADPQSAPQQGINAALISLAYMHTDDAIARFTKVVDSFCHTAPADPRDPKSVAPASRAKDGILAIYQAQNNLDAIEATNNKFIQNQCGDKAAIDLAISVNKQMKFQRAKLAFDQKKYLEAAQGFYAYYKTAPATDSDLPTALYNAAVAYKLGDRPKTAIALFKEFTANPNKAFRDSSFYLDAKRLTAATYQAAFQYDDAIREYLDLYAAATKAKKNGVKLPEIPGQPPPPSLDQVALDALYNAAFAAELGHDFKRAIDLYGQYGRTETDHRKQDRAVWSTAGIYRQSGDVTSMTETLDRWRAKYGRDQGNADDLVKSYADTAELWRKKGRTAQAKQAENDAIDAWKKTGSPKNTPGAKLVANFALSDAEDYYNKTWATLSITRQITATNMKTVKTEIGQMKDSIEKTRKASEDKYIALDQYGVLESSMAAKVRFGDIQYDRAQKIANIPIPKALANYPQVVEAFEAQRDEALKKDLDEARHDWEDVYNAAKQGGVSNKWSQHAAENLSREFPDEYHTLRQELVQGTDTP